MSPDDYRAVISRLGLSQVGAARFLGVDERQSRRWASGETIVPYSVGLLLRVSARLVEDCWTLDDITSA